jgi:hypothetical protein
VFCLVTSSDVGFAASSSAVQGAQYSVLVNQQVLTMDVQPGDGQLVVNQTRAMTLATTYLPGSANATSVQSQYVLLTLRDASGTIAGGVQAQPAWLITFQGVAYVPSNASASVCSCSVIYQRPNTVVTINARTGALVTLFGAGD